MRVVAFRGTGLPFKVVDVTVQGLRQLVDELRHAEGPRSRRPTGIAKGWTRAAISALMAACSTARISGISVSAI